MKIKIDGIPIEGEPLYIALILEQLIYQMGSHYKEIKEEE